MKITTLIENTAGDERINQSIQVLKEMNVKTIGLSHCTGENAVNTLKGAFTDLFVIRQVLF